MRITMLLVVAVLGLLNLPVAVGQALPDRSASASPAPKVTSQLSAQPNLAHVAQPAAITIEADSPALLKEQLKVMREYHGSLLDTVYWSLVVVVTIALLLAGYSWWSTFKVYEHKLSDLERRLTSTIDASIADAARQVDSKLHAQLAQVSASAADVERSIVARQDASATSLAESIAATERALGERNDTLAATLAQRTSEQEARLEARSEALLLRLSSDSADIRSRLVVIEERLAKLDSLIKKREEETGELRQFVVEGLAYSEADLRMVEEHVWLLKGIPDNVAITQSQAIEAAVNAKAVWRLKFMLQRVKGTLQDEFLAKSRKLSEAAFGNLQKALKTAEGSASGADVAGVLLTEVRDLLQAAAPEKK